MKLTKKQQQLAQNYFYARQKYGLRHLESVYKCPSFAKMQAEDSIFEEIFQINDKQEKYKACEYCITGFNSNMFSCGYAIRNRENDILVAIIYHTVYNRYIIPLYDEILNELEGILQ